MKAKFIIPLLLILLGTANAEDLPEDAQRLRDQKDARVAEIEKIYHRELEALKAKYTKLGDLSSAIAIARLLGDTNFDSLTEEGEDLPKNDNDLRIFLRDTKWKFGDGRAITLQRNGKVKKSWGVLEPEWSVKDLKLVYEGKAFTFNDKFSTIEETTKKEFSGEGKRVSE